MKPHIEVQPGTDHVVSLVLHCHDCGAEKTVEVRRAGWERYARGGMAQDCFPELDDDDCERIISGTCPPCWDKLFPEEGDDHG